MTSAPPLTDMQALASSRARARDHGMFLHHAAADEIQDRLQLVKKDFTSPAVVTGFPAFWGAQMPSARILPDTDTLDLAAGAHDLIVHAMSMHWANDTVGQLIQCRRALRPDGLFLAVALGGQTLHELRSCLAQAESDLRGGLSPRIAPMAELRDIGGLLQRAGLALPVADILPLKVAYRDAFHLMHDLRAMGETNALYSRTRQPTPRGLFRHAAELYANNFGTDDGKITATFELIFLTGWAPADSQPKPLRPGSAQQRLADALHTRETGLPD